MTSLIRNDTLEYLRKHYPGILPCVRDDILEFGLPDRGITIFTVIVNSVLLVISVIGNSLMVFLYTKYKTLRTAGNKLVVNLAIANFIMHAKSWVLIVNGIAGGPILGELGCISFGGFGTQSALCEIWTITCIAYERCTAISTPLTRAKRLGHTKVNCLLGFIWSSSIFFALLPFFGMGSYVLDPSFITCLMDAWSTDALDRAYVVILVVTAWFIPLLTITYCYLRIFCYTRVTRASLKSQHSEQSSDSISSVRLRYHRSTSTTSKHDHPSRNVFKLEKKLASRLLLIILVWLCGWTPFAVISVLQLLGYGHRVNKNVSLLAMVLCKFSSILNAGLYGMRLPKFRRKIIKLLSLFWPTVNANDKIESPNPMKKPGKTCGIQCEVVEIGSGGGVGGVRRRHVSAKVVKFQDKSACTVSSIKQEQSCTLKFQQNLESFEESSSSIEFKVVTVASQIDRTPIKEVLIVNLGDKQYNLIHHCENGRRLSL